MYAEYHAARIAGVHKTYKELTLSWGISIHTVWKSMKSAKARAQERGEGNPDALVLKPADVSGQIDRAFTRLEGLKREVSLVEENLRNLFHQVPKHSKFTTLAFGKASGKAGAARSRKVRIHFLSWSTREFELSPLYGLEDNHKTTPEEEAYEKHRYVVRELLELEFLRTEARKSDESLVRLRKEVDRKKVLTWTPVVMRMRNLVNGWEDLERGAVTEADLEGLSEYLTRLEAKNESDGPAPEA